MIARKSIVGLTVLCALVFSAFASANASAAGTTAYTCAKTGTTEAVGEKFSDADCTTTSPEGTFRHWTIKEKESTAYTATGTTESILKGTVGGAAFELKATGFSGTGTLENLPGPPMSVSGTIEGTFTGVTVVKPAGKECVVKGGQIKLLSSKVTSKVEGGKMWSHVEPTGTKLAEFVLEKCTGAFGEGVNGVTQSVTGSADTEHEAEGMGSGAFLVFTEASTKEGLKLAGQAASFTGKFTTKNTASGTAISYTTTSS